MHSFLIKKKHNQVAQCYPQETRSFPQQIINLLYENYQNLNPNLRKTMVQGLILLRNKDIIPSITVLSLFYTLFRVHDKQLRDLLYTHIISDIKNTNAKHKNNKLNKTLQNFMYTILQSTTDSTNVVAAKKSLDACIELYKKGIWNDSKTVNIISEACFHSVTKIKVAAIQFFLGSNNANQDEDSEDDYDIPDIKRLQHINLVNKTKRSKCLYCCKKSSLYESGSRLIRFCSCGILFDHKDNDWSEGSTKVTIKYIICTASRPIESRVTEKTWCSWSSSDTATNFQ
ncbi:10992_t:CDS:2, partial [Cetraspora pellucida]